MPQDSVTALTIYVVFVVFYFIIHSLYLGLQQSFCFTVFVTFLSVIILLAIDMVFEGMNFFEEFDTRNGSVEIQYWVLKREN
jgi:hypothetical protein